MRAKATPLLLRDKTIEDAVPTVAVVHPKPVAADRDHYAPRQYRRLV